MAERFRQVHPDQIVTFNDGRELAVVSEEHFVNEVAKIASFIAFAGGTMSAVVYRQPTDLRGEMVTVGAVLSWADFTKTRAQPEPASMPPGYEEPPTVEVGEVAEMPELQRKTRAAAEAEVASRDGGLGAAALPFQEDKPDLSGKIEELQPAEGFKWNGRGRETIPQPDGRAYRAAANAEREVEIEAERRAMTADGEPVLPRPGRDDDVDDGLSGIGGEDLSEIPEHMR
jgi:hypothetical protein